MSEEKTSTSWSNPVAGKQTAPASLLALTLEGHLTHEWTLPYDGRPIEVSYDVFPVGVRMDILQRTSGLDLHSKEILIEFFSLAHALKVIDGWTFKGGDIEEKIAWIRTLSEPLYALFVEQLRTARLAQIKKFDERRDLLGKPSPDRS